MFGNSGMQAEVFKATRLGMQVNLQSPIPTSFYITVAN